ncbi:hypothetical protein, partial [Streptomyces prunicolor]
MSTTPLEQAGIDHEPAAANETGAGRGGTAQPAAYPAPTRSTVTTPVGPECGALERRFVPGAEV